MDVINPKERNVVQALLDWIGQHHAVAGSRLPNERSLTEELGVSRNTIRRALSRLEQHGVIVRSSTRGTFIERPPDQRQARQILDGFHQRPPRHRRRMPDARACVAAASSYRIAVLYSRQEFTPPLRDQFSGIFEKALERNHQLTFGRARIPSPVYKRLPFSGLFHHPNADGMIIVDTIFPEDIPLIKKLPIPYVVISDTVMNNSITIDYAAGCRCAVTELASHGRCDIAVLAPSATPMLIETLRSTTESLRHELNLPGIRFYSGQNAIGQMWRDGLPEGLFASDDEICREICHKLAGDGVTIGRDIEVISHANKGSDSSLPSAVGRLEFDLVQCGRLAMERIEQMLDGGQHTFACMSQGPVFHHGQAADQVDSP